MLTSKLITLITLIFPLIFGSSGVFDSTNDDFIIVNNGDAIEIKTSEDLPREKCSLTIIEKQFALTAGHCGEVGSEVYSTPEGIIIGKITENLLTSGTGVDVAVISLSQKTKGKPINGNFEYIPHSGDELEILDTNYTKIPGEVLKNEPITRKVKTRNGKYNAEVWLATLPAKRGDSGGPILHNGKIVGLIQGGNTKDITLFSTLKDKYKQSKNRGTPNNSSYIEQYLSSSE